MESNIGVPCRGTPSAACKDQAKLFVYKAVRRLHLAGELSTVLRATRSIHLNASNVSSEPSADGVEGSEQYAGRHFDGPLYRLRSRKLCQWITIAGVGQRQRKTNHLGMRRHSKLSRTAVARATSSDTVETIEQKSKTQEIFEILEQRRASGQQGRWISHFHNPFCTCTVGKQAHLAMFAIDGCLLFVCSWRRRRGHHIPGIAAGRPGMGCAQECKGPSNCC